MRVSGPYQTDVPRPPARGARLARRDEGAYRQYATEEQRRQPGCPARPARYICLVRSTRAISALTVLTTTLLVLVGTAQQNNRFAVSPRHPAIEYGTRPRTDRAARLHAQLRAGEVTLAFDRERGYLRALLDALNIPIESQTLVFSHTSLQADFITPETPRAIYFTDDVAVAWIPGAPAIEIAALDPRQGVMFYAVRQQVIPAPPFERPRTCVECHISDTTLGVPGLAVGSTVIDAEGVPFSAIPVDHRTALKERWGGWYVTGDTGEGPHVGNTVATTAINPTLEIDPANLNLPSVEDRIDSARYLTPYSDAAALMVLEHQTHMTNLLTRTGWEFRVAAHEGRATGGDGAPSALDPALAKTVDALVDYMVFVDEAPLDDAVQGSAGFEAVFEKRGPFDSQGRTLRSLDLTTRLFRYPCSYMIYTAAFDALPAAAQHAVYERLWQVLSGAEPAARLLLDDRQAIVEILRETKPGLPSYFEPPVR